MQAPGEAMAAAKQLGISMAQLAAAGGSSGAARLMQAPGEAVEDQESSRQIGRHGVFDSAV